MARRPRLDAGQELAEIAHARRERAARSAQAGSSPRTWPSSFRCDPQPELLTITVSTPSNASITRRANARPSSPRPACIESAPQQPCGGATTS